MMDIIQLERYYTKAELEDIYTTLTLLTEKLHAQPEQPTWIQAVANMRHIDVKYFNDLKCFFIPNLEYLQEVLGETIYKDLRYGFINTNGKYVSSTFKARFIFPCWNMKNKVVGFIGYDSDAPSYKYLLSTTVGFEKSMITLGYDYLDYIYKCDYVILVEGVMDYLRLRSLGYPVICLQGTLIYPNIRRIINRVSHTITFLDTDSAGMKARLTVLKTLKANTDIQLKLYGLGKMDADTYLMFKENADHFKEVIERIKVDWTESKYLTEVLENHSPELTEKIRKALEQEAELQERLKQLKEEGTI